VGSASAKIKIKGAGTGQTIIRQPSTAQNILNVQGQHYGFYDLDFTGGSRGIRLGTRTAPLLHVPRIPQPIPVFLAFFHTN
jgi:hypothetical protein